MAPIDSLPCPMKGLFTTMLRNVPANSVYLGSFEVMKQKAAEAKGVAVSELPAGYVLGAAGLGGIMYWTAIYPIDVCKSAIMTVNPPCTPMACNGVHFYVVLRVFGDPCMQHSFWHECSIEMKGMCSLSWADLAFPVYRTTLTQPSGNTPTSGPLPR